METPRTALRPPSRAPWIVLAVVVVIAAAVMTALWYRHRAAGPPAPAMAPPADAGQPEAASPDAGTVSLEPGRARSLLESVSAHPLFRRGLEGGDVVRRWAVVTDNLAEGVSPRKQLDFLAPTSPFSVVERGGRSVIAPESYRRYDAFADAVGSVDVSILTRVYRELRPALEAAYRALGYPDASFDRVSARALQRIVAAPVRDGEVAVERKGDMFLFADPKLEELGAVEKHLLRMGPRNARILQSKARELLAQLAPGAASTDAHR